MRKLLRRIELRNSYFVYQEGESYLVASEDRRGQRHERKVSSHAVHHLREKLRGQQVTAERAARTLEPVATNLGLAYTYGRKLRFCTQDALLILVALKEAHMAKEKRSYLYSICEKDAARKDPGL